MTYIKTLQTVYIISFLDLFAIGLTFPLFSTHLRDLGVSHYVIGLIGSTYSGTQIISGPIIGAWSDVRGRKSVLQITLVVCGICYGLLGITNSILFISLLRFTLGLIKHTQSICKTVIMDLVPQNEQTGAFGRSAAFGSIGFIAGPFIGGHLSDLESGFSYVCGVTTILFVLNFVLVSTLPDRLNKHETKRENGYFLRNIKQELATTFHDLAAIDWKRHWNSLIIRFLFGLTISSFFNSQSIYLKQIYSMSQKQIGYTISFYSTIGTISAFFLDYVNRLFKNDHSCYIRLLNFFTLMTLCLTGIYLSSSLTIFLFLLVPFALSSTVLRVVSMELMVKNSEKSGSLSGASNSVMSISRFVTPFLIGMFTEIFGEEFIMLLTAFPGFLGICITLYLYKSTQVKLKDQ